MPKPELQALYPGLAKQQYWADVISQPVVPGSDQKEVRHGRLEVTVWGTQVQNPAVLLIDHYNPRYLRG